MTVRGVRLLVQALILPITLMCGPIVSARAAEPHLTPLQIEAIKEARAIGAHYRVPDLLVAVIWQESSFCAQRLGDDGKSFGCGQVQLKTAKRMAGHYISAHQLIHDRRLNLEIAARYLHYCIERFEIERGLYCFNHGDGAAARATARAVRDDSYVEKVLAHFGRVGGLLSDR